MLNRALITATNFLGATLWKAGYRHPLRNMKDLRLVFYHGIGNKSSPCLRYLNDETSRDNFIKQIDELAKQYIILPLPEAIRRVTEDSEIPQKPFCSISFDDGLSTVYTEAYPILEERKLSATVFLNTSVIGNRTLLWLHFITYLISTFGANHIARYFDSIRPNTILSPLHYNEFELLRWCRDNFGFIYSTRTLDKIAEELNVDIAEVAQKEQLYLSWDQIDDMAKAGFNFYSHTANHTPLRKLPEDAIKKEIEEAHHILSSHDKSFGKFVSFPFGMFEDFGPKAPEIALASGHDFVFEVGYGLNPLTRVKNNRIFSRVSLGEIRAVPSDIYSAIELRPLCKWLLDPIKRIKKALLL